MKTITLANLKEASLQEVFDQVAKHLLTQKEQCRTSDRNGECVYLNEKGQKCAAGCLISTEEYKPEMDKESEDGQLGSSWFSLIERGLVPDTEHKFFIASLQNLHDNNESSYFKIALEKLGNNYNLNTDVLQVEY